MRSLKNVAFRSILTVLVFVFISVGLSCHTTHWQRVKEPTLLLHSKVAVRGGIQKLYFVLSNPTSETMFYSVECENTETKANKVNSEIVKIGPHSDKMISILYSQIKGFKQTLKCWMLEENNPDDKDW